MLRERETADGAELGQVRVAVGAARDHLLSLQQPDGHWCGELEGDTILESEYALLLVVPRTPARAASSSASRNYLREPGRASTAAGRASPAGPPRSARRSRPTSCSSSPATIPTLPHMRAARAAILRAWRPRRLQLVHEDPALHLRRLRLGQGARGAARDHPAAALVLLQHLRDVVVVAGDRGAALDPVGAEAVVRAAGSCRLDELRVAESARGPTPRPPSSRRASGSGARFFLAIDGLIKEIEELVARSVPAARARSRRALGRRTARGKRRPGRDLPVDHEHGPGAGRCRGHDVDDPLVRVQLAELEKLEIAEATSVCTSSPASRRCGTPRWRSTRCSSRAFARRPRAAARRALAARSRSAARAATGRSRTQTPSRAAGTSSTPTSSTPTATTPPRCSPRSIASRCATPKEEARRRAALDRGLRWQLGDAVAATAAGPRSTRTATANPQLVPFADHNAMLDPSTVDVTSRTIEALIGMGHRRRRTRDPSRGRVPVEASRSPTAAGTGAGAPTTSTAPGSR